MPEIGTTLREARMRQRIDISEVEAETKIRGKYLRALENEEWNLLPGPTYVKSFLRTYADALGLDGRLLVEEYKLRHERLSDIELQPIAPPRVRDGRRAPRRPRRRVPRWLVVGLVVVGLLAALGLLNRDNKRDATPSTPSTSTRTTPAAGGARSTTAAERRRRRRQRAAAARIVRPQGLPTGPVFVCVVDARGRRLIPGSTLQPGAASRTFRSSRFRINLGNSSVRLRVNGRVRTVPASSTAIGYEITRARGRTPLPLGQRPTCG